MVRVGVLGLSAANFQKVVVRGGFLRIIANRHLNN